MPNLIPQLRADLPAILDDAGDNAARRIIEFFTAEIRNKNTRDAYGRAVRQFFDWAAGHGLTLNTIEPVHVAAYVEQDTRAPATIKQHLSAISRLYDWLVTGQVVESNPAAPVRPPKLVRREGTTPVLTAGETRDLLDAIVHTAGGPGPGGQPTDSQRTSDEQGTDAKPGLSGGDDSIVGKDSVAAQSAKGVGVGRLRDRAIIGVMIYTFARVSAVARLSVGDYYRAGHRRFLRLREKGGQERSIPAHHKMQDYLEAYLDAAGIRKKKNAPLFQSLQGRSGTLTGKRILPANILHMVKRRAKEAGFDPEQVCCHTFRGTGITTYLENGGDLEMAQHIAGHASPETTRLYDRRRQQASREEIERIRI
ncbi:tyrosine-type recombinase/integrase [Salisaeta longa]|uniref:tyrosine-type recombinase/integrase n=1 Tax=Salisaeta longa TaxID=503170 RepID=UPI0003B499DA|nr:tyrosine-type recombinase/integrase [Salisaeta longa]